MKKSIFIFMLLPLLSHSQKLARNETDKFTGAIVKETEWIRLQGTDKDYSHVRIRKIDSVIIFDFKIVTKEVVSVNEGDALMFRFENNDVMELRNEEFTLSGRGNGSTGITYSNVQGLDLRYKVSEEELAKMYSHKAIALRIYTSQGYLEGDIKEKRWAKLTESIALILE